MIEQTAASVEPPAASGSNAKHAQNASNKIHLVVQKVLLPLLHTPLPGAVSFKQVSKGFFYLDLIIKLY